MTSSHWKGYKATASCPNSHTLSILYLYAYLRAAALSVTWRVELPHWAMAAALPRCSWEAGTGKEWGRGWTWATATKDTGWKMFPNLAPGERSVRTSTIHANAVLGQQATRCAREEEPPSPNADAASYRQQLWDTTRKWFHQLAFNTSSFTLHRALV